MNLGNGHRARGTQYRTGAIVMEGVTESGEGYAVEIERDEIVAFNEAGYNSTRVNVKQLVAWLRANRPDLLE